MENNNNNQPPSSPLPPPPPPPPQLHSSADAASLTVQLFSHNDSQKSSSEIFASLFPPPSLLGENSTCIRCSQPIQYEAFNSQVWATANGTSAENVAKNTAIANSSVMNMDRRSIFQERIEPCPLSSSIYYGGLEDMYIRSSSNLTSKSYSKYFMKKDSKDDPNHLQSDPRGNWWQGSLYY